MSPIRIAGLFYTFTDGELLLVPELQMPFPKSPKKVLHEFEADFYRASPHYATTVEVRVDAEPSVVEALNLGVRHRLVTILGSVESRPSRGIMQPWVIAQKIVLHGDIADRAYEIYLGGQGGTAEENWRGAEDELLSQ